MEPMSEGQLTWALRAHKADHVRRALRAMVGARVGAETQGELVIAGYRAGSELYELRG